jgi:hypothetical protein
MATPDRNEPDTRAVAKDDARSLAEARHRIAGLLAIAYRRFATIQRAAEQQKTSANPGLANKSGPSVHGVVP